MPDIYTDGQYLETTATWHVEDSPWKAQQIKAILDENALRPTTVADVGCGGGLILDELSRMDGLQDANFAGYDVSPQAIELANKLGAEGVDFIHEDLVAEGNTARFDLLLVIDVFEHVADYWRFVEQCRAKATYKIYHIPLDIHVSSVWRNVLTRNRYTTGHLHYFTADSALCTLRDTGHEILDYSYTSGAFGLFKQHPTLKKAVANVPRWVLSHFSVRLAARLFGGYSLLVLTT